jgi:ParB family chromosome partitioning protein
VVPVGPFVLFSPPKGITVKLAYSPTADAAAFDLSSFGFEFVEGGVDPKTLVIRDNVRLDDHVEQDQELRDSVRARGVRTAINAYRASDGTIVVLRGHRRTLAAVLEGRERVPVMLEPEPTAEERIGDQLVENDKRRGLATAEHVAAYEQLAVLGLTAEQIAARAATPLATVKAGLAVAKVPAAVRAVREHDQLDVFTANVFAEFADDEAALAVLEEAIGKSNWNHTVRGLRTDRRKVKIRADAEDALERENPGLKVLRGMDRLNLFTPNGKLWRLESMKLSPGVDKDMTLAKHKKCPGHAAGVEIDHKGYDDSNEQILVPKTVWVCTNAPFYGHEPRFGSSSGGKVKLAEMDPQKAAEERAKAAMTRANNSAMRVATTERRNFVRSLLDRKKAPRGAQQIIASALFRDRDKLRFTMERSSRTAHAMFGMPLGQYESTKGEFWALSDDVSDARAEVISLVNVLCAYEEGMDDAAWRIVDGGQQRYLKFLVSAGYTLSPVEEMAAGLREVVNLDKPAEVPA